MRRFLILLLISITLAFSGCQSLMDFFNIPSDSSTADERDIYKAKTGRYPN